MRIGIISDVHRQPERVTSGITKLKDLGVERLILNGDIGEHAETLQESQEYSARILEAVAESGLESYVQPGSHETLHGFGIVVDTIAQKHSNIVNMLRTPSIDISGYRLAFLPGSDVHSGGEYHLRADIPSGQYAVTEQSLVVLDSYATLQRLSSENRMQGVIQVKNMHELRNVVEDPEKTIVVCHVPAYFPLGSQGVDHAYFATKEEGGFIPGFVLEQQIRQAIRERYGKECSAQDIDKIAQANGFTFRRENVGNKDLRRIVDDLGIRYAVNGHIHESGHHAHTKNGDAVFESVPLPELFWNSGCFDRGQMGILTLHEQGVAYQNVGM